MENTGSKGETNNMENREDMRNTESKKATENNENIGSTESMESTDELLSLSQEKFRLLESLIRNQIEVKDGLINKLHGELQYYKDDKSDKFVEQLMKSIIKIRKDMKKLMMSEQWTSINVEALKEQYTYIFEDLTDLLELQNVTPYSSKPGDAFDGKLHQAKLEPTDKRELDRTVKESLSEGYKKGDKNIISERVVVYSYQGGQN